MANKLDEIRRRVIVSRVPHDLDSPQQTVDDRRELLHRLDRALAALKEVGDDYPGSSCQQWCQMKIAELSS